jgi:hypothetical protein
METMLKGKKSYIVAILMLAVGVVNMLTGDAGGMQMVMDNAMVLLNGAGLMALRAGVDKAAG